MSFISSCWKPPPVTDPRSWSSEPTSWSRWMQICPRDVGPCVKCGVPVYEGQSRLMFCIDWNLLILLRNSIHVELVNMFWYVWCLMDCSCIVFFVEHHCYIVGFLKISFAIFRQKALWILHKLSWVFILRWNVQTFEATHSLGHLWKDMRSKRTGPVSMAELAQDAATASVTLRSLPRP